MAEISRIWSIDRRHIQWPWKTRTPVSRSRHSLTLNILEYRHNFSGIIIIIITDLYSAFRSKIHNRDLHSYYSTVSFRMTLSDLEWLSKIFNDTKHRAVSLRQLNFLFVSVLVDIALASMYNFLAATSCSTVQLPILECIGQKVKWAPPGVESQCSRQPRRPGIQVRHFRRSAVLYLLQS